jgi:hypothetical protein
MANIKAVVTKVDASTDNITILEESHSQNRTMATIYNNSTSVLYLKYGSDASLDSFTIKLLGGDYLELPAPCYTGRIDGFWEAVDGNAMVTEIS